MEIKKTITDLIQQELEGSDHFLVSVESNEAGNSYKFFIDGKEGVGIKVCSKLSRTVSAVIDEMDLGDSPFRYEISSPGADKPLVDKRQYFQHIGRKLNIECKDDLVFEGELKEVMDDHLILEVFVSKHKKEQKNILFDNIIKSKVIISFKRKKK
ncbi:MAG: hypothetical protein KJP21_04185 [Bacteroidia bacterium]|nr:hypothetical protein [Bacteroidia bacterium]NNJ55077.1 hypothetical protein [Bacteroidia bacterium]